MTADAPVLRVELDDAGPLGAHDAAVMAMLSRVLEHRSMRRRAKYIAKTFGATTRLRFHEDQAAASLVPSRWTTLFERHDVAALVGDAAADSSQWWTNVRDTSYGSAVFFGDSRCPTAAPQQWFWEPSTDPAAMPAAEDGKRIRQALALDALAEALHDACELAVCDLMLDTPILGRVDRAMLHPFIPHERKPWGASLIVEINGVDVVLPIRFISPEG